MGRREGIQPKRNLRFLRSVHQRKKGQSRRASASIDRISCGEEVLPIFCNGSSGKTADIRARISYSCPMKRALTLSLLAAGFWAAGILSLSFVEGHDGLLTVMLYLCFAAGVISLLIAAAIMFFDLVKSLWKRDSRTHHRLMEGSRP